MVKKISKSPGAASATTSSAAGAPEAAAQISQLAALVKDSAQQIWLAGMGAFAKAQGGGNKVFEALVQEGMGLQRKTQTLAEEKISEVTGKMTAMADTVSSRAGQNWDKLEALFEQRTAKALGRLGVPTAKDVQALTERVDALAAAVSRLGGAPATAAKRTKRAAAPLTAKRAVKAASAPFGKAAKTSKATKARRAA
jgi:poly(hydroxyalkanoate) granule-associated protein